VVIKRCLRFNPIGLGGQRPPNHFPRWRATPAESFPETAGNLSRAEFKISVAQATSAMARLAIVRATGFAYEEPTTSQ
jgi:hypothetical protein